MTTKTKRETLRDLRDQIESPYRDQIRDLCLAIHDYYRHLVDAAVEAASSSYETMIVVSRLVILSLADSEPRDPYRGMPLGDDDVAGEPPEIAAMRREVLTLRVQMAVAVTNAVNLHQLAAKKKRKTQGGALTSECINCYVPDGEPS